MDNSVNLESGNKKTYIRLSAGTSLVTVKPCFSPESNYVFVVADSAVKVFSTKTGDCLHLLVNNKGTLVALFLNPTNSLQLITVASDGWVCYWDYEDAVLIREITIEQKIVDAFPSNKGNSLFVVTDAEDNSRLLQFKLDFTKSGKTTFRQIHNSNNCKKMVAFNKSITMVALVKNNVLQIKELSSGYSVRHLITDNLEFTCVAWHTTEECVATGDSLGRVILWYNYLSEGKKTIRTTLHWHSNPVGDIAFTAAGSYLFSGGYECVLVKWKLGSDSKQFMPRLGMPICFVTCSPDNAIVATSHVDNTILLLNPTLEVMHSIQGLSSTHHWEDSATDPVPTGLLYAPHQEALVLNGRPGHLQFYSLNEEKQLYNLDITQQNYISRERNRVVYQLEVIKAAFDAFGNWLATVEYRNDKETSPEVRLKFWGYKNKQQRFSLNTTIEMPHWEIVNALLFRPVNPDVSPDDYVPMAVTTGDDKRLRIWTLVNDEDKPEKEKVWTCSGVGFFRDLPARSASFSEDGSVLAVAFGPVLTLWLPDTNELRSSLCHPKVKEDIRHAIFGRCECSHLVACATDQFMTVWDTLSLSVLWFVEVGVTFMTGDSLSSSMAAFSNAGDLFIFRPSSPKPIAIHPQVNSGKVIAAAFLPRETHDKNVDWGANSQLYFMNSEQNLYTISTEEEDPMADPKIGKMQLRRHLPLTPFGLLMAESRKSGVEKVKSAFHELKGSASKKIIKMMLTTPCHVLPSPRELSSSYLSSLMKPLQERAYEDDIARSDDDDGDELSVKKAQQNSYSDSDDGDDNDTGTMDISETKKRTTTIPNTKSENILSKHQDLDEDCLKTVREEDYSWLFSSTLFDNHTDRTV